MIPILQTRKRGSEQARDLLRSPAARGRGGTATQDCVTPQGPAFFCTLLRGSIPPRDNQVFLTLKKGKCQLSGEGFSNETLEGVSTTLSINRNANS